MTPRALLLPGLLLALILPAACYTPQDHPHRVKEDVVFYKEYCHYCGAAWNSHMFKCPNPRCIIKNGAQNSGPCPRCEEPWPPGLREGPCPVCDAWYEVGPVIPGFGYSKEVEDRYNSGNRSDPPRYR